MWLPLTISVILCQIFAVAPAAVSTTGSNNFDVKLLQDVLSQNSGNVVIAPLNVKAALTTLVEGAGGTTRQELLSTLGLPSDLATFRKVVAQSFVSSKSAKSEISFANRVFAANGLTVAANFVDVLKTYYNGDVTRVDFSGPSAADDINKWVKEATRNNIDSLVDKDSYSSDTLVLLASALYFKSQWKITFDKEQTSKACFSVPETGCKNVDFMRNLISEYGYAEIEALGSKVVEILYENEKTSMLVFLPVNESLPALDSVAEKLLDTPISTIRGSLRSQELDLKFPKFSIETKSELSENLKQLGIKEAFEDGADLSGMLPNVPASVDKVLHNAKIEINEEGTIAAALTGALIGFRFGGAPRPVAINRPFLFAIVDRQSNDILFAGRIVKP